MMIDSYAVGSIHLIFKFWSYCLSYCHVPSLDVFLHGIIHETCWLVPLVPQVLQVLVICLCVRDVAQMCWLVPPVPPVLLVLQVLVICLCVRDVAQMCWPVLLVLQVLVICLCVRDVTQTCWLVWLLCAWRGSDVLTSSTSSSGACDLPVQSSGAWSGPRYW